MARVHKVPARRELIKNLKRLKKHTHTAAFYSVSPSTIGQWCKILEITSTDYGAVRGCNTSLRPSKREFLKAVDELGHDAVAIGKRYGTRRCTAMRWFTHYGVDRSCLLEALPADVPLIMALKGQLPCAVVAKKFDLYTRTVGRLWGS